MVIALSSIIYGIIFHVLCYSVYSVHTVTTITIFNKLMPIGVLKISIVKFANNKMDFDSQSQSTNKSLTPFNDAIPLTFMVAVCARFHVSYLLF